MRKKQETQTDDIIQKVIDKIVKAHGEGSALLMSQHQAQDTPSIPSGIFCIDKATGIGGFPKGRMIEMYGSPACGKTTLALHIISNLQKIDKNVVCAYLDVEQSLNIDYLSTLEIDAERLLISQPSSAEETVSIAAECMLTRKEDGTCPFGVIVIDSVAAMIPEAEIMAEPGEMQMGLQARLMGQACRKLTPLCNQSNVLLIWINQTRDKIGVSYGSPVTTTGGHALKFYTSMRLEAHIIGQLKDNDSVIGNRIKLKFVKNKMAPPFKVCEYDLIFGRGVDPLLCYLDFAVDSGIVTRAGAWYSFGEVKLGMGRDAASNFLKNNNDVLMSMIEKIA